MPAFLLDRPKEPGFATYLVVIVNPAEIMQIFSHFQVAIVRMHLQSQLQRYLQYL